MVYNMTEQRFIISCPMKRVKGKLARCHSKFCIADGEVCEHLLMVYAIE